ncbi:hypothetical protein [Proteus sp. fly-1008]|uniref:hypothetical protein n=1 Tax=Proteus sp. fly-1008 TaxID=3136672 RepID=UPI0032D9B6D3|nr:hypothetical protein [Proteus hauseri]
MELVSITIISQTDTYTLQVKNTTSVGGIVLYVVKLLIIQCVLIKLNHFFT